MFASNYPVDKSDGVGAERLWVGWLEVVEEADASRAMQGLTFAPFLRPGGFSQACRRPVGGAA